MPDDADDYVERIYEVRALPEIDTVELIRVDRRKHKYGDGAAPTEIPGDHIKRLDSTLAQQVAGMFRALPIGTDGYRCHNPYYGLRFEQSGRRLVEAAICFDCFNMTVVEEGPLQWAYFDAKAPESVALLQLLMAQDPKPPSPAPADDANF